MPDQTSLWWLPWVLALSGLATWAALAAWRRSERAVAVRRLGWAIVPWAGWLLGLFTLGWRVVDAFGDWGTRFVFNPAAWLGFVAGGVSVVLIWAGYHFSGDADEPKPRRKRRRAVEAGDSGDSGAGEFADIEAILKKRGIS